MTFLCGLFLFAINAFICSRLWLAGYIDQMGSVEGSFIALNRYISRHWSDLLWFPEWFCGMPFLRVYQPGLHVTGAAIATIFRLPPESAFHWLCAFLYSLGPVTFYWLCCRLTGRRGYAFAAALTFSLVSPSAFLSTAIRNDLGGLFFARRYQMLVHYGEGPHIAALTLLPLVIWSLDRAVSGVRSVFIPLAAALLGALVVTNWTGTIGLCLALLAYFASRASELRLSGWLTALGIAILAYLLVSPWLSPSIVLDVPANAQASDSTLLGRFQLIVLAAVLAVLAMLEVLFQRTRVDRTFRFFLYFFICAGTVVLGKLWFGVALLPQAHRFQPEMEMAFFGSVMFPLTAIWKRSPPIARAFGIVTLVVLCLLQTRSYRGYVNTQTLPRAIEATIEYRMAKWFEGHMDGRRVFAPGSVSIWMNAFVDTPQMVGCCDQSVPSLEQRLAFFTIYTDTNAGDRAAAISLLWLKAYGASAIGVSGPGSSEFFKPYAHPHKFDGLLKELWRDGDNVIYEVPQRSASLAHVIRPDQEVLRAPVHGLDVDPLKPFVEALDDPALPPADMRWTNSHEIHISAPLSRGQLISVQTSYAPGWRASANGALARVRADALGLVIIEPHCAGSCEVDMVYDGGAERRWTHSAQLLGLLACIAWLLALRSKRSTANAQ